MSQPAVHGECSTAVTQGTPPPTSLLLLPSERTESVTGVCLAYGLLADEVGDHGAGRLEDRADVAELSVLTTKVFLGCAAGQSP